MNSNLEILGTGLYGTVYKINDITIVKTQKITISDYDNYHKRNKTKYLDSLIFRELYFNKIIKKKISQEDKHFFLNFYGDQLIKINKEVNEGIALIDNQSYYNDLKNSEYGINFFYDYKDGIVDDIIDNLNELQIYSMIIQLTYALNLIHNLGFIHNDIHLKNIAYIKTDAEKYINIMNHKVPTYGYIFSLIDYGMVLSKRFKLSENEEANINIDYRDNIRLLSNIIFYGVGRAVHYQIFNNNLIKYFKKITRTIKKTDQFKLLQNKYNHIDPNYLDYIFRIKYQHDFLKIIYIEESKYDEYLKNKLDDVSIEFYLNNIKNPDNIINYFIDKLMI